MKVALVVGHRLSSQGACAPDICEFDFNEDLAHMVARFIPESYVVYRETYRGLPDKINKEKPELIISFHCNAFNKKVSGTETLYYYKSKKGKKLAKKLQKAIVNVLDLKDRGIKPKSAEDRGGYLLKYTNAPCVIIEPFFIDNPIDLVIATELKKELSEAIAMAILEIK